MAKKNIDLRGSISDLHKLSGKTVSDIKNQEETKLSINPTAKKKDGLKEIDKIEEAPTNKDTSDIKNVLKRADDKTREQATKSLKGYSEDSEFLAALGSTFNISITDTIHGLISNFKNQFPEETKDIEDYIKLTNKRLSKYK